MKPTPVEKKIAIFRKDVFEVGSDLDLGTGESELEQLDDFVQRFDDLSMTVIWHKPAVLYDLLVKKVVGVQLD